MPTTELHGLAGQPILLEVADAPKLTEATLFRWELAEAPSGSGNVSPPETTPQVSVTPRQRGEYLYLRWIDEDLSDELTHQFVLSIEGMPPIAVVAREPEARVGTSVQLDGSGSWSIERRPLSYRWRLTTRPANSASALSAVDTPTTLFVPDMPGFYGVTLDVFDGELWNTSPAVDAIDVVL